ncbi:MAG: hypothetical protein LBS57_04290 [Treponema sp.]|nr:hypothetical protein [Treponema sp.]
MTVYIFSAAAFLICSCTQFFSSSLAPWAARDPGALVPPVTTGNVKELIEVAENNPDLSLEVLRGIDKALQDANDDEKNSLQAAALQAASNASGMGTAIMHQAGNISEIMEDKDNAKKLVTDVLQDMDNLSDTSNLLVDILPEPGTPEFDAFVKKANADDLAIAAAILLAAESKEQINSGDYFNSFNPNDPAASLNPRENLAVGLAKSALDKSDEPNSGLSGRLQDILEGLNLLDSTEIP